MTFASLFSLASVYHNSRALIAHLHSCVLKLTQLDHLRIIARISPKPHANKEGKAFSAFPSFHKLSAIGNITGASVVPI